MNRVLVAVLGSVIVACSSGPSASDASVCPPKAKTATLPGTGVPGTGGSATAGIVEVTSFGDNPGALKMFVHAPKGGKASAIVVALHGCTQGASDYVGAGWNDLADAAGFAVVYPEQTTANNYQRCFRWFEEAQIAREGGEAASIAAMTAYAKSQYGATKAFVTGLSAGAAMTAVMLATYPDVFEAGAIMAGLPYACATSQTDAYSCMSPGRDKSAEAWAELVPSAARSKPPRVSIWHGDSDWIVRPMNEEQLVKQWTGASGIAAEPSSSETLAGATHAQYKDASGVVRVESWLIKGMGHGVALAPKDGCGKAGAYLLDEGVCSTTKAAAFFGLIDADGKPTPGGSGGSGATPSSGGATGDCDP
ncbi:MAG: Esterase, depolymerase family [Labilithrix sp.]|nr:Esterase, depolymerase family [Labilithrix sp.]